MTDTQQLLQLTEDNVALLIEQYDALLAERRQLRETIERQHNEIMHAHADLVNLQKEHKRLQMAFALTAESEQRVVAKAKLTRLINLIDKSISQLADCEIEADDANQIEETSSLQ